MDIYTYLKKDHRYVAELMEKVVKNDNAKQRAGLFAEIKMELMLHADTEEPTFYAAIDKATRSKQVEEKLEHADKEHDEIRDYLKKLSTTSVTDNQWIEIFGEFKYSVTHHVEEEEEDIFKKAKKYLDHAEAVQLAKDMDAMKQAMKQKLQAAA